MNKSELKQLIREEISKVTSEGIFDRFSKKDYRLPSPIRKEGNHYIFSNPESPNGEMEFFYGGKDVPGEFDKKGGFAYQYSEDENLKQLAIDWLEKHNVPYQESNTHPDYPNFKDMIEFDAKYVKPNPSI
tara:strand:+ start:296 stop:685 length:390 start_codon:yes stop_codon:yes gene_type:complete